MPFAVMPRKSRPPIASSWLALAMSSTSGAPAPARARQRLPAPRPRPRAHQPEGSHPRGTRAAARCGLPPAVVPVTAPPECAAARVRCQARGWEPWCRARPASARPAAPHPSP
eukprot:6467062-Prymnesium_polylepis.1